MYILHQKSKAESDITLFIKSVVSASSADVLYLTHIWFHIRLCNEIPSHINYISDANTYHLLNDDAIFLLYCNLYVP